MPCDVPKVPLPRDHKATVCIWADLQVTQTEDMLAAAADVTELRRLIADAFHLEDHNENSRSAILLDLYFNTIRFALEKGFSKEQVSAFFSIVKKTHEVCIETPFGNLDQCFGYFKELVLCHAVKRPPWSVNLYSPEQVQLVTEYMVNTYFRHFKLYKYAFTPVVKLDLSMTYIGLPETPEPETAVQQETTTDQVDEDCVEKSRDVSAVPEETEQIQEPTNEESPAIQELRKIITAQLTEEIEKLRTSLDDRIQLNDDSLQQKLSAAEGESGSKARRGSTRGKKK